MPIFSMFFAALCCFYSGGASAAAVTNLTDVPQKIEVRSVGGEDFTTIVIEPGRTWRLDIKTVVRFAEHNYNILEREEFAIWKDGTFGPQRANPRGGSAF